MKSKILQQQILSLIFVSYFILLISCKGKGGSSTTEDAQHVNSVDSSVALFSYNALEAILIKAHSKQIRKNHADSLREYYLKYQTYALPTIDSNGNQENLIRFTFRVTDIRAILDSCKATSTLALRFGLEDPSPFETNEVNGPTWHLIVYGLNDKVLAKSATDPISGCPIFENSGNSPATYKANNQIASYAASLMKAYKNDGTYLLSTIYPDEPPANKKTILYGFSFDASQIRAIIDTNSSKVIPDNIEFFIGINHFNVKGTIKTSWHMIAYGSYNGTLLDYSVIPVRSSTEIPGIAKDPKTANFVPESVYDKATPCPPCNP